MTFISLGADVMTFSVLGVAEVEVHREVVNRTVYDRFLGLYYDWDALVHDVTVGPDWLGMPTPYEAFPFVLAAVNRMSAHERLRIAAALAEYGDDAA